MEDGLKSEGKCVYCDKTFTQDGMTQHLKTHLIASEKSYRSPEIAFHLALDSGSMFLQILVRGNEKFTILDEFLREIWVDCCGHLSGFSHNKMKIKMSLKLQDALVPKIKIRYDYDFGSTTTLYLKVAGMYHLATKEPLLLLSRNEPLKIMCSICRSKPAVALCAIHMHETDNHFFCADCVQKHELECEDFADYANMPVVNSPRMGVCGYEGGGIDWERDGAYGM